MDETIFQNLPNGNKLEARRTPPPENRYFVEVLSPEGKVFDSFEYIVGDPNDPFDIADNEHIDIERRIAIEALIKRLV